METGENSICKVKIAGKLFSCYKFAINKSNDTTAATLLLIVPFILKKSLLADTTLKESTWRRFVPGSEKKVLHLWNWAGKIRQVL
jgi:hypothetical protein